MGGEVGGGTAGDWKNQEEAGEKQWQIARRQMCPLCCSVDYVDSVAFSLITCTLGDIT